MPITSPHLKISSSKPVRDNAYTTGFQRFKVRKSPSVLTVFELTTCWNDGVVCLYWIKWNMLLNYFYLLFFPLQYIYKTFYSIHITLLYLYVMRLFDITETLYQQSAKLSVRNYPVNSKSISCTFFSNLRDHCKRRVGKYS